MELSSLENTYYKNDDIAIYQGDALSILRSMPDNLVDCVVTSPPYWGLRDYGTPPQIWDGHPNCNHVWGDKQLHPSRGNRGEGVDPKHKVAGIKQPTVVDSQFCLRCSAWRGSLGLEPTFELYVKHICNIFDEIKRVLKEEGTLWLNLGDTYSGSHQGYGKNTLTRLSEKKNENLGSVKTYLEKYKHTINKPPPSAKTSLPDKCLCMIPSRVAIEMTARGWILRNDIIWHKPSCLGGGTALYAKTQKGARPADLKDLVRLKPETVELWDGKKWNRVLQWVENKNPQNKLEITLRSGEKIVCTGEHRFLIKNKQVAAVDLRVGDILDNTRIPDTEGYAPRHLPDEIGWLIGLYIAEGSRCDHGRNLHFSSHIKECTRFHNLARIATDYSATCLRQITSPNGMELSIRSRIISSIIDTYIDGKDCRTKHLTRKAWQRNNEFLNNVLIGYLSGDGGYDKANNRWRLGFAANDCLANDLRCICAKMGYKSRVARRNGYYYGEIRFTENDHHNRKSQYEIIKITRAREFKTKFWDIVLEDEPHIFSTAGGTLIHNCLPNSVKDRFTTDYEHIFFFCKNRRYYFKQQFEPFKSSSLLRAKYGSYSKKTDAGIHGGMTLKTQLRSFKKIETGELPGRNKRCVWTIASQSFKGSHFAVYPPALITSMIDAGCPERGIVLDPFTGSGTTGLVAKRLGKRFIGIELSQKYIEEIIMQRLTKEAVLV